MGIPLPNIPVRFRRAVEIRMYWTFLVVDDNEAERRTTVTAISRIVPGAHVWEADSARAATQLLEEKRTVPSLILLDYDLGESTGLDAFGDIRTRHWLDRAPVIFLSEPITDRQMLKCYQMGALAFLPKPLQQFELRQAIREFAREARTLQAAGVVHPQAAGRRTAA